MSADETSSPRCHTGSFPQAQVRDAPGGLLAVVQRSRLWLLTLACLCLAVWLAWSSMPPSGPTIVITFPQGHGLKAGDAVRYRGIDVGQVERVSLSPGLQSVEAVVVLNPEAGAVSREGSRFWIVRPVVSLTEVRGLETLVGARYIGVSPADPGSPPVSVFDGLPSPPADELAAGGLTLVLRAPERHGISAGSPIDWRGMPVGVVLSAGLAPDARHVDFTVRIDRPYRRLIRKESRFWITSGFDMDIGLSGLRLNAESLTTIARGGISLMTPASASDEECRPGHVFAMSDPPDDAWLASVGSAPFVDFELPETVTVEAQARTSFLGFTRTVKQTQVGLLIGSADAPLLVTPDFDGDRMRVTHPAFGDLTLRIAERVPPNDIGTAVDAPRRSVDAEGRSAPSHGHDQVVEDVAVFRMADGVIGMPVTFGTSVVSPASFRIPAEPEACLLVRSGDADGRATAIIQALDVHQLKSSPAGDWQLVDDSLDLTAWHGAAVVASVDGRLLGILVAGDRQTTILPVAETWWNTTAVSAER